MCFNIHERLSSFYPGCLISCKIFTVAFSTRLCYSAAAFSICTLWLYHLWIKFARAATFELLMDHHATPLTPVLVCTLRKYQSTPFETHRQSYHGYTGDKALEPWATNRQRNARLCFLWWTHAHTRHILWPEFQGRG